MTDGKVEEIIGSAFAQNRYLRYRSMEYRMHSEYYALTIMRAYDGKQPKSMYIVRCGSDGNTVLVAESLAEIKLRVRDFINETEEQEEEI